MSRCPSCGIRLEYDHDSCPQCERPLTPPRDSHGVGDGPSPDDRESRFTGDEPLKTIAKFANAAEAGFFAHALTATEDLPVMIHAEENFDAISGYWSTRYLLEVPERIAESAYRSLQSLIARTETEDIMESVVPAGTRWETERFAMTDFRDRSFDTTAAESGVRWGPIVFSLAAGSLAFFGLQALQPAVNPRNDVPHGERRKDLWEQMSRPSKPWTQSLNGNRRRELRFNAKRTRAVIREYDGKVQTSEREFPLQNDAK